MIRFYISILANCMIFRRKQCQLEAEEAAEKDHLKTIKKINETEHSQSQSKPTGRPCVIHRNGATEVGKKDDLVNEVTEKENAQFEQVLKSNGISKVATDITIEDEICFENIKPMEIFKELEGPQDIRVLNKSLQKQKLASEAGLFREETRGTTPSKSFSLSRRWAEVQTGQVRTKASSYLSPEQQRLANTNKSPAVKVSDHSMAPS